MELYLEDSLSPQLYIKQVFVNILHLLCFDLEIKYLSVDVYFIFLHNFYDQIIPLDLSLPGQASWTWSALIIFIPTLYLVMISFYYSDV